MRFPPANLKMRYPPPHLNVIYVQFMHNSGIAPDYSVFINGIRRQDISLEELSKLTKTEKYIRTLEERDCRQIVVDYSSEEGCLPTFFNKDSAGIWWASVWRNEYHIRVGNASEMTWENMCAADQSAWNMRNSTRELRLADRQLRSQKRRRLRKSNPQTANRRKQPKQSESDDDKDIAVPLYQPRFTLRMWLLYVLVITVLHFVVRFIFA